jgi:hypothetical protein
MKKNILITLLLVIVALMIVGCGKNDNLDSSEKDEPKQKETSKKDKQKEEEKKEEKKDNKENTIIEDDEIIDFDDEENKPPAQNDRVTVEKVINCDGCVFAYFSGEGDKAKKLGDTVSSSEYTTDINTLKTSGGKQRHNFFGLVLSGNTISRAYACILKDNKIYCLEGSTNGAYHNSNVAILNQIFNSDQCKTISDGHTYTCSDGSYNGDSKTNGYTSMHYETSCTIYSTDSNAGKLICH